MESRFTIERAETNPITELGRCEQFAVDMTLAQLIVRQLGARNLVVGDGIYAWFANVRIQLFEGSAGVLRPFLLTIDQKGQCVITRHAGEQMPRAMHRAFAALTPADEDIITAEIAPPKPRTLRTW